LGRFLLFKSNTLRQQVPFSTNDSMACSIAVMADKQGRLCSRGGTVQAQHGVHHVRHVCAILLSMGDLERQVVHARRCWRQDRKMKLYERWELDQAGCWRRHRFLHSEMFELRKFEDPMEQLRKSMAPILVSLQLLHSALSVCLRVSTQTVVSGHMALCVFEPRYSHLPLSQQRRQKKRVGFLL
jgi:hypothetical protein